MCMIKMPSTSASGISLSALASSSSSLDMRGATSSGIMAIAGPSSSSGGTSSSASRRNVPSQQSQDEDRDSASDEVKVFNDEDEREPALPNSSSENRTLQLDFLTNIKDTLISETEQVSFRLVSVVMNNNKTNKFLNN